MPCPMLIFEEITVTERAPTPSPEALIETLLEGNDPRAISPPVSVRVAGEMCALFKIEPLTVICPASDEPVEIETLVPLFSALLMLDTLIVLVARAVKSVPEVKDVPLFDAVDIVTLKGSSSHSPPLPKGEAALTIMPSVNRR